MITVQVIDKAQASGSSTINLFPLQERVNQVNLVAKRYRKQGFWARLVMFRKHGDDIQKLRKSIEDVLPIMGLAGIVTIAKGVRNIENQLEEVSAENGGETFYL